MAGSIVITRGARATEELLLSEVRQLLQESREDPRQLARPARILVPTRSLREHLLATLAREIGAVAGVSVQTLRGLCFELLDNVGEEARGGDPLLPVLVRQIASRQPVLAAVLDGLKDGYGVVAATVSDLLDAGLESAHLEAVQDALLDVGGPTGERARAIPAVAVKALAELEAAGLEHRSGFFRRGREALEDHPEVALPCRALWIHGVADATGVLADLLEALVRHAGARVIIDQPDRPLEPGVSDAGNRFTERLLRRLEGVVPVERALQEPAAPALELFRAPGARSEARAVAERVWRLIHEDRVVPERIGVVARDLGPYAIALRGQLRRLGVPFSGGPDSSGPLAPMGRRVRALLDLLWLRGATPGDRWLDAVGGLGRGARADLRVALHALGLARLEQVAELDLEAVLEGEDSLALPVRRGFVQPGSASRSESGSTGKPGPTVAARRRVSRRNLEIVRQRARGVLARFVAWRDEPDLGGHFRQLEGWLRDDLAWRGPSSFRSEVSGIAAELVASLGPALELGFDDFVLLLERALRGIGTVPLGGEGAGVAVLDVLEARARTFEHLFVVGMNRDLFPRGIHEDPLLPDPLRERLEKGPLPDVPLKRRGYDEERYLFAQLLSAAPRVTLSWQAVTDDGKERAASPLVERLRLTRRHGRAQESDRIADAGVEVDVDLGVELVRSPTSDPRGQGVRRAVPRPAHEHLVLAGLYGQRSLFDPVFALALQETASQLGLGGSLPPVETVAAARCAVLDEAEPHRRRPRDLGPYFGFVGPCTSPVDPRRNALYVTQVEALARCGWRGFLERILRIEPVPDARTDLPSVTPLLLGAVLHRVLEEIAREAGVPGGGNLGDLLTTGKARDVTWPTGRLEPLLLAAARRVARDEAISLPGFPRLLARRVAPLLARVREVEFGPEDILHDVLGVEVEGTMLLPDARGRFHELDELGDERDGGVLHFRADRVDLGTAGPVLTDYKSGKPPSRGEVPKKVETLRRDHLEAIAAGRSLQGVAYALADVAGAAPSQPTGRYLYARPDLPEVAVELRIPEEDAEAIASFESALAATLTAHGQGSFAPRLLDAKGDGARHCEHCVVAEACVRGDSGARGRLRSWLEARGPERDASLLPAERAFLDLWRMGSS